MSGTNADQTAVETEGLDREKGVRGLPEPSKPGPLDIVYVEASPAQIEATLNGISTQTDAFLNMAVNPARDNLQIQQFYTRDNNRREMSKPARVGQQAGQQQAEQKITTKSPITERLKGPTTLGIANTDQPGSSNAFQGRAQRVPSSLKQNINLFTQQTMDQRAIRHGQRPRINASIEELRRNHNPQF